MRSRWKWLLPHSSHRGRVLVANNLVASTLCSDTPQRWIWAAALCLPGGEGGLQTPSPPSDCRQQKDTVVVRAG